MRHWDQLKVFELDGLKVVIDKSWENCHPRDFFDDNIDPATGEPYNDVEQICEDIDAGKLDWFILRCRFMFEDVEIASGTIGGMLYEDARDALTDGMADDLVYEVSQEAVSRIHELSKKFMMLSLRHSGVDALEV